MSLDPRVLAELERRGPEKASAMLDSHAAGAGEPAVIRLGITDCPDPWPFEVEFWLSETIKELEAEALATRRHDQQMDVGRATVKWAKWASVAAALSVLVAVFFGILQFFSGSGR